MDVRKEERAATCNHRQGNLQEEVIRIASILELRRDKGHVVLQLAAAELDAAEKCRRILRDVKEHVGELDALLSRAEIQDDHLVIVPVGQLVAALRVVRMALGGQS